MPRKQQWRNAKNHDEIALDCASPKLYLVTIGAVESSDIRNMRRLSVVARGVIDAIDKVSFDRQWEYVSDCEFQADIDIE